MKEYIYYAVGYDYQRPTEWILGSHTKALKAFGSAAVANEDKRVRVLVEVYVVHEDDKVQHKCERGCPLHLVSKHEWIHKSWQVPAWMRKAAARIS